MLKNWCLTFLIKQNMSLKLKKSHHVLEFNQSQCLKPYVEFNTKKIIEAEKKWRQRWKSVVQIHKQCAIRQNNGKLEN